MFKKNKKAWIKIVEAFVAILLVMGVLLIIIDRGGFERKGIPEIYKKELSILREVQLNDTLRNEILRLEESVFPVEWKDFNSNGLEDIRNKIIEKKPDGLDCEAKVCILEDDCILNKDFEKDVYVQSVAIVANLEVYHPRQLKLFCWESGA